MLGTHQWGTARMAVIREQRLAEVEVVCLGARPPEPNAAAAEARGAPRLQNAAAVLQQDLEDCMQGCEEE